MVRAKDWKSLCRRFKSSPRHPYSYFFVDVILLSNLFCFSLFFSSLFKFKTIFCSWHLILSVVSKGSLLAFKESTASLAFKESTGKESSLFQPPLLLFFFACLKRNHTSFSFRANQEARSAYCFALSLLSFQPKSASSFVLFYPTLVYYCAVLFFKECNNNERMKKLKVSLGVVSLKPSKETTARPLWLLNNNKKSQLVAATQFIEG